MTVIRKLQWNENLHSYFIVIPKQIVEAMEMEKGKPFRFSIKGKKLVMNPHLNNEEITQAVGQGEGEK